MRCPSGLNMIGFFVACIILCSIIWYVAVYTGAGLAFGIFFAFGAASLIGMLAIFLPVLFIDSKLTNLVCDES